jgi:hypothetical protein
MKLFKSTSNLSRPVFISNYPLVKTDIHLASVYDFRSLPRDPSVYCIFKKDHSDWLRDHLDRDVPEDFTIETSGPVRTKFHLTKNSAVWNWEIEWKMNTFKHRGDNPFDLYTCVKVPVIKR